MWSNVISIDKCFKKEIEFLLSSVKNVRDLSYAVEESKDRIWIYLASLCEKSGAVEEELTCLVEDVLLTYMKTSFFLDRLPSLSLTYSTCALVCSLVHFDRGYEENLLRKAVAETADFNVDGLFNFRLQELKQNWEDGVNLALRLLSATDSDTYDVASFITGVDNNVNRIAISGGRVYNLTEGKEVKILDVFDEKDFNLIMAVVGQYPEEIVIEDNISKALCDTLKHIATVVYRN